MTNLNSIRALVATSLLALALAGPAAAFGVEDGKEAETSDKSGSDKSGTDVSKGDTGKDACCGKDHGKGYGKDHDKDKDPDPEPTPPSKEGDRNIEQRPAATNLIACDTSKRLLLSSENAVVGNIDGIDCLDDGTVLYHVLLADAFNSEARRAVFKTTVAPTPGGQVRLQLTNMQVKKLIWMNAAH